jgi:hypothetical protein
MITEGLADIGTLGARSYHMKPTTVEALVHILEL